MKIGILTFWWTKDNYGQILQCYALQQFLKQQGHDAYLIRYDPRCDLKKTTLIKKIMKCFNPQKLYIHLDYLLNEKKNAKKILIEENNNPRFFEIFFNENIKVSDKVYKTYNELKQNPPEADLYIVGSDQVWNPALYSDIALHAFFLDFGDKKIKRMSYAASWGRIDLNPKKTKEIIPLLKKFNYISVREKSGLELCKKCGVNNAFWVPDPTMLLNKFSYLNLIKNVDMEKCNKYILLYILKNKFNFDLNIVYDFASRNNLEVIYVTANGVSDNRKKVFPTVQEWISLINNAEYIITNSFHCAVFSTIFGKKYGIIPLSSYFKGMNSRFLSLFELYHIENRFITNSNLEILKKEYVTNDTIEEAVQSFISALNNL